MDINTRRYFEDLCGKRLCLSGSAQSLLSLEPICIAGTGSCQKTKKFCAEAGCKFLCCNISSKDVMENVGLAGGERVVTGRGVKRKTKRGKCKIFLLFFLTKA